MPNATTRKRLLVEPDTAVLFHKYTTTLENTDEDNQSGKWMDFKLRITLRILAGLEDEGIELIQRLPNLRLFPVVILRRSRLNFV